MIRHANPPPSLAASGRMLALLPAMLLGLLLGLTAGCRSGPSSESASTAARLNLRSVIDPDAVQPLAFSRGVYSLSTPDEAVIVLTDGPSDAPTRALIIRTLWRARAGLTPLEASATNATMFHVELAGSSDAVRVFEGAGYTTADPDPDDRSMSAAIRSCHLTLTDERGDADPDPSAASPGDPPSAATDPASPPNGPPASNPNPDPASSLPANPTSNPASSSPSPSASLYAKATLTGSFTARRDDAAVASLLTTLRSSLTQRLGYPRLVRADDR